MGCWWVKWVGWQRIFLTDLTDGLLVGEMGWLVTGGFEKPGFCEKPGFWWVTGLKKTTN